MKRKLLKLQPMKTSFNLENFFVNDRLFTKNFIMKTFFLLFAALSSIIGLAQNIASENRVLNLPPDYIVAEKTNINIDYSFKLAAMPQNEPLNFKAGDFLAMAPEGKIAYYTEYEPQKLQYYITAKNFYDQLSNRVKATFTIEELWYIYYFDQKLKNTLQAVK